jgi:hypothetical protein
MRFSTIRSANGLTVRSYANSLFMFDETWSKKEYDIPGFALIRGMTVVDVGANQGFIPCTRRIAMQCHESRMEEAAAILRNAGFETACEG